MNFARRKKFFAFVFVPLFLPPLFGDGGENYFLDEKYAKVSSLLKGFLAEDLELKKNVLEAQNKRLELDAVKISGGISVSLATGNVTFSTQDNSFDVSPSLSVSIPQFQNAALQIDFPLEVENSQTAMQDGTVSLSADLISSASKKRKIELLEAERELSESLQNVKKRAVSAEIEFYENLKTLLEKNVSIHEKKGELYDDSLDLKVLETQGYSKNSAKYRQAELKVAGDKNEIHEAEREFVRKTALFAFKCGAGNQPDSYEDAAAFLPDAVPSVELVKISDFDKNSYTKIESALWQNSIGNLKRDADSDFSLNAAAQYKLNSKKSDCDDVGGKLNFGWNGLTLSAGVFAPTNNSLFGNLKPSGTPLSSSPYIEFSAAVNPSEFRLSAIEKSQKKIQKDQEEIDIKIAEDEYDSTVLEKIGVFNDILWEKEVSAQELELYTQLEKDMKNWLSQGIVTESDAEDSKTKKEQAELNVMINSLEHIIYNNEIKLLFKM